MSKLILKMLLPACFFAFLQFFLGSLVFAGGAWIVSFFLSSARAAFIKIFIPYIIVIFSSVGLIKAIWIFLLNWKRLARKEFRGRNS
jgi:hypothetical protein